MGAATISIPGLPDLLTTGQSQANWRPRREHLLELFREHIYGRRPDTAYDVSWTVTRTDRAAINGTATLKLIDITVAAGKRSLTFQLRLFSPNRSAKPAPAFLLICNRNKQNIDYTRRLKRSFWPVENLIANGFATAAFHNAALDPDYDDGFRNGIHRVLDRGVRGGAAWGTISAWAFGASRALDYLTADPDVNAKQVAVIGHSRGGKTALWAGAADERFALAISNDSGCTGAAPARRREGETVKAINDRFPHWFCSNYRQYNFCEDLLPVDQHMLIALMAPRAAYVASASEDAWADPVGEFLSVKAAEPAWGLFGDTPVMPRTPPPIETPVHGRRLGYHLRQGGHGLRDYDWEQYIAFARKLFRLR